MQGMGLVVILFFFGLAGGIVIAALGTRAFMTGRGM